MRGKLVILCAALLVGLSPPGAVACAWAAAVAVAGTQETPRDAHVQTPAPAQPAVAPVLARAAILSVRLGETLGAHPKTQRLIWRSPSGPMPSQAPPAQG